MLSRDIVTIVRSFHKLIITLLVISFFASGLFGVPVYGAINQQINYQGKLTDAVGVDVTDGSYSIVFRLYTVSSGGSHIWTETQSVDVVDGLFSVMLGSVSSLSAVDFNQTLYLGVNVGGDGEMVPRKIIGSVPTAFTADKLDNLDSTDFLSTSTVSAPKLWSLPGLGEIGSSSATTTVLGRLAVTGSTIINGLLSAYQTITAPNFVATSSTASILPYASSTAITVSGTASTTNLIVSGNSTLGTVSSGLWNGSTIGVGYGGTGLSATPTYGQILVGNGSGYTLSATSTLGISLSDTTGTLGATRGGTGLTSVTLNEILIGGSGNTWSQVATSSLGLPTFSSLADYLSLSSWYATTTDGLDEGGTNLYFTNDRFDARLSATTSLNNLWSLSGLGSIGSSSAVTTILGTTSLTNLIVSGNVRFSDLANCDTIDTDANGNLSCGTDAGAGGGISSLNGLTDAGQTFATSSDTNIGLSIVSSGSTHTFTPTWTGSLSVARGGTGLTSVPSYGELLLGNGSGYTLTATSSLGLPTFSSLADYLSLSSWYATTTDGLDEGGTNLYFTNTRARGAISESITGLDYDNSSGILSLTSGYNIPLSASTTNWNGFYDTPSSRITAGTGLSWSGNTLNSTLASNWSFDTNFSQSVLTPSSTVPVWFKDAIYASSSLIVQGADFATTTIGSNETYLQIIKKNIAGIIDVPILTGRTSLGTSGAGALDGFNLVGDTQDPTFDFYGTTTIDNAKITYNVINDTLDFTLANSYSFDSNLGIGTTSPMSKLSVDGSVTFQGTNFATTTIGNQSNFFEIKEQPIIGGLIRVPMLFGKALGTIVGDITGVPVNHQLLVVEDTSLNLNPALILLGSTGDSASITWATSSQSLIFGGSDDPQFEFQGNVGIGTTSPMSTFSVDGSVTFQGTNFATTTIGDKDDYFTFGAYSGLLPMLSAHNSLGTNAGLLENSWYVIEGSAGNADPTFGLVDTTLSTASTFTMSTSTGLLTLISPGGFNFDGDGTGNFGIGTTSPWKDLSVAGDFSLTGGFFDSSASGGSDGYILQSTGVGTNWVATTSLGINADSLGIVSSQWEDVSGGINYDGILNINSVQMIYMPTDFTGSLFLGNGGQNLSSGSVPDGWWNTFIGLDAGLNITTGTSNTGVGFSALKANTSGIGNTALGHAALQNNTTGGGNVAIGVAALGSNITGTNNTALGAYALNQTNSNYNTAIGLGALRYNVTGERNIGIGADSLSNNLSATNTIAIGHESGKGIAGGYSNQEGLYIGHYTASNLEDGSDYNTIIGNWAGFEITTGSSNLLIGYQNGDEITTGSSNLLIGNDTGSNIITGSNNILIGSGVSASSSTSVGQLNIGNVLYGLNIHNYLVDGISSTPTVGGRIGIGTSTPQSTLGVEGTGLFTGNVFFPSNSTGIFFDSFGTFSNGIFKDSNGNLDIRVNGSTEKVTINTSGSVGIGTTTPWRTLSVNGLSDLGVNALAGSFTATSTTASVFPYASTTALTNTGVLYLDGIGDPDDTELLRFSMDRSWTFRTEGTGSTNALVTRSETGSKSWYINASDDSNVATFNAVSSGSSKFGIGTTTPWRTLSVNGTVGFEGLTLNTGAAAASLCLSNKNEVSRNTDNETCLASSERYKKNIETISEGLDEILALRSVTFEYKDKDGVRIGLIAEEAEGVNPLLVSYDEQGMPNGIRWSHITTLLVKSVQEMWAKLTNHEDRLNQLEQENAELKARVDALTGESSSGSSSSQNNSSDDEEVGNNDGDSPIEEEVSPLEEGGSGESSEVDSNDSSSSSDLEDTTDSNSDSGVVGDLSGQTEDDSVSESSDTGDSSSEPGSEPGSDSGGESSSDAGGSSGESSSEGSSESSE